MVLVKSLKTSSHVFRLETSMVGNKTITQYNALATYYFYSPETVGCGSIVFLGSTLRSKIKISCHYFKVLTSYLLDRELSLTSAQLDKSIQNYTNPTLSILIDN